MSLYVNGMITGALVACAVISSSDLIRWEQAHLWGALCFATAIVRIIYFDRPSRRSAPGGGR